MNAEPSAEWWLDAEGNDTCPCHAKPQRRPDPNVCVHCGNYWDTPQHFYACRADRITDGKSTGHSAPSVTQP